MKNVQNALRKVLVPLNHFVHRIVLLIAQISMMAMVAIVTLTEDELIIRGRRGGFVQPGSRSFTYRPLPTSCVRSYRLHWPNP